MEFINLFPKCLGISKLDMTDNEYDIVMKTIKDTNLDTYLTDTEKDERYVFNYLENKNLSFFKEKIMQSLREYVDEAYGSKTQEYGMTTSWLKAFYKNESGHFHQHRNSMISGLYYPEEVPEGKQGDLILYDTSCERTSYFVKRDDDKDMECFHVRPLKNRIVFFPSYLFHSVNVNLTGKTRYSIAFNFLPIGPTGKHDSYTNLR